MPSNQVAPFGAGKVLDEAPPSFEEGSSGAGLFSAASASQRDLELGGSAASCAMAQDTKEEVRRA